MLLAVLGYALEAPGIDTEDKNSLAEELLLEPDSRPEHEIIPKLLGMRTRILVSGESRLM